MLAERFDAVLVDLDGVVYVGDEPLPNAVSALSRLRTHGVELRFLTNDPTRIRDAIADRLNEMGVDAVREEIVTSSWATAQYVARNGVETAYAVGTSGLEADLETADVDVVEHNPDAVVVGSSDHVNYGHIREATAFIYDGARFVATNTDGSYPTPRGPAPGTGAIVRAIETATETPPTVVGKPEPEMFDIAVDGLATDNVLMVGDNPRTDVLGAHRAGFTAALIADEPVSYPSPVDFRTPDATIPNLSGLFDSDVTVREWEKPAFEWPNRVVATVAAVVTDGDDVLLRRIDDGWAVPTREIEPGETIVETARRAVEPAEVDISTLELAGVFSDPASQVVVESSGRRTQHITCCVTGRSDGGSASGEFSFVDPDEADLANPHRQWLADALGGKSTSLR